jgi:3-hydroxy-9,10-secoandrosta-1,3,5(10)-triene-9,17-dione monooxygenase reductase component
MTPEPAPAEITPDRLRLALSRMPTAVTVVTALTADGPAGLSANAVTSLSLDPPLMLACLDRGSRTLRAVEESGRFGINVLGARAEELVHGFARKVPVPAKWEGVDWEAEDGVPRLAGAIAFVACELRDVLSGGDHVIVTGEVRHVAEREGDPLLFFGGDYLALERTPEGR